MDNKINREEIGKKAQITVFIIIAILIIASIILYFLIFKKSIPGISQGVEKFPSGLEPNSYIEKCSRDSIEQAVDVLFAHGGVLNPENSYKYESQDIIFLCYNANYYNPCIMQYPKYIENLESEIKTYIGPKIEDCFLKLKNELQSRGYQINMENMELNIELLPKKIRADINKKFKVTKNQETREFENFKAQIISPLYDLAIVAQEIAGQEAKYCNFEYIGYILFYPDFDIDKFITWDEVKIYTIKHKNHKNQLRFAIRSCAMPPGL